MMKDFTSSIINQFNLANDFFFSTALGLGSFDRKVGRDKICASYTTLQAFQPNFRGTIKATCVCELHTENSISFMVAYMLNPSFTI